MAITHRNGIWGIDIYVQGKRVRRVAGKTQKDAATLHKKYERDKFDFEKLGIQNPKRIKIKDFFTRYLQYCHDNKTTKTARSDGSRIQILLQFFDQHNILYLSGITPLLVEDFKSERLKTASATTFNKYLELLKAALNKAVEWDLIADNRIGKVKRLRIDTARKVRFFTDEEIKRFLDKADGFLKSVIQIFLYTGMRLSELVNLTWEDIDFKNRLINIQSKERFSPKSKKARSIPINSQLFEVLSGLPREGRYVFDNGKNQPLYTGQVYYDRFVYVLHKLGLSGRLHDLRHTFASHLVMSGVSLKAVQELLGHSSITITEIYAHLSPGLLKDAVERLKFGQNQVTA